MPRPLAPIPTHQPPKAQLTSPRTRFKVYSMSHRILRPSLQPFTPSQIYTSARSASTASKALKISRLCPPLSSAHPASLLALRPTQVSVTLSTLHRQLLTEQRHGFHTTPARPKDHHFDTLKFVQRLQAEGFSEEQSEALMRVLSDVIEERYTITSIHSLLLS
jgi:hypothetical protein